MSTITASSESANGVLRGGAAPPTSDGGARFWLKTAAAMPKFTAAAVGGAALFLAYIVSTSGGSSRTAIGLLAVTLIVCGIFAARAAWESLAARRLDINVMMLLGAGLAVAVGEPFEGALLLFLFVLANGMEELARGRAEIALHELKQKFPDQAVVERGGERSTIGLHEVAVGDRLIVRPGDRVACDGVVVEGHSHVDESSITGEFMPRSRRAGDAVFAGSLNVEAALVVKVQKAAAESTLARIAEFVAAARLRKTELEQFLDRIGRYYGPAVLAAAVLLGVGTLIGGSGTSAALYRAIGLIIVASPCALMLASPVPILAAISRAARWGVVCKGGVFLEQLAGVHTLFVDKTGTLTEGRVRLASIDVVRGGEHDLLAVAAGLERDSTHPLAQAVLRYADARQIAPRTAERVTMVSGHGIEAIIEGAPARLGRPEWALEGLAESVRAAALQQVAASEAWGRTPVVLAHGARLGVLSFEDTPRAAAMNFAEDLRAVGVRRIELLTGDRRRVGEALAARLQLDGCRAELLPEQKLAVVESAAGAAPGVAFLGDGVNDAPSLARADVGIAMGGIGSDTAMEAADFVLLHDRIERVPQLIGLARRTQRIIRQNAAFALAVIVALAIWVSVSPRPSLSLGVVGHEGSTLLVVLNGLRLLREAR